MSPHTLLPDEPDKVVSKIHAWRGKSAEIARACGLHRTSVYQWRKVPPQWVQVVAELTEMTPEQIRPDIFKPRKHATKK